MVKITKILHRPFDYPCKETKKKDASDIYVIYTTNNFYISIYIDIKI